MLRFPFAKTPTLSFLPLSYLVSGNWKVLGCPLEEKILCYQETLFQISTLSDKLTIKIFLLPRDFYCLLGGKERKIYPKLLIND